VSWSRLEAQVAQAILTAGGGVPLRSYLLDLIGLTSPLSEELSLTQIVAAVAALAIRLNLQLVLVGSDSTAAE
jgi:hypothetical protein